MKKKSWLSILALSMALAACQNEEQSDTSRAEEEPVEEAEQQEEAAAETESVLAELEEMNLPALPEEPQDFVQQGNGLLQSEKENGNEEVKFLELFGDVPALPEDATQEEMELYYQYIHNITRVQLPDPSGVLDMARFDMEGMPEADPRYEFKENYNIEVILDASGSMGADAGGETRMEQAKREIQSFLSSAPEEANVSLRVYGHEGTGDDADKEMSCAAIEEVYERGPYDEAAFQEALDQFEPSGWTPVAGALESAAESFEGLDGEENTNLIYLVSDGIETCDGNPVEAAKSFAGSNISPIINVIGFNADSEAQQQLKDVAKEAGGAYANVNNAEGLRSEFERTEDILQEWKQWRVGARNDRNWTSVHATMDINNFSIAWQNNARAQVNSEYNAMSQLMDEGKITYDQLGPMKDLATANFDLARETGSAFYEELQRMKEEGVEGMDQMIEDSKPDGE
ncbi:vWA domain-containing protein [Jeotgalibacillus terrae]|uniref:VWA domain-containing protein n=1 Tax=Jeotgalibacillus terrae TaxID=587735 RepID=A0ABW5ZJ35_9BACL|nr:VWA domain-containing protein [Jeotgalibacillus terrae]MBM7578703.1 Ca-activated chloride channel family protein [Jeotgalibacillus terrae]